MPIVFGYGQQPVDEPRPAEVEQREHAGAGDGEERHRLGEAVDRRAPLLAQQQQDRRDQRAGVADADPPDEVDDVEAPADRDVDAPDADAARRAGSRSRQSSSISSANDDARSRRTSRAASSRSRTIALILSVTEPKVWPGAMTGGARSVAVRWRSRCRDRAAGSASRAPGSGCAPRPGRWCAAACSARQQRVVARVGLQLARPRLSGR